MKMVIARISLVLLVTLLWACVSTGGPKPGELGSIEKPIRPVFVIWPDGCVTASVDIKHDKLETVVNQSDRFCRDNNGQWVQVDHKDMKTAVDDPWLAKTLQSLLPGVATAATQGAFGVWAKGVEADGIVDAAKAAATINGQTATDVATTNGQTAQAVATANNSTQLEIAEMQAEAAANRGPSTIIHNMPVANSNSSSAAITPVNAVSGSTATSGATTNVNGGCGPDGTLCQ